jgi:sugar phosphate isomerase/epimerase
MHERSGKSPEIRQIRDGILPNLPGSDECGWGVPFFLKKDRWLPPQVRGAAIMGRVNTCFTPPGGNLTMPKKTTALTAAPNRRDFLTTVAGSATAAALLPARSLWADDVASEPGKWQMKLSTSTIQFSSLPIEKACERIAKLGFPAVDIWSAHAGCPHLDDCLNRLGPNGLSELLERTHLKLFAFSTYRGGFAQYAELLGKVGGGVAVQGSSGRCDPAELRTRMGQFMENVKPLVELAEKNNSYLAIENHGNALLDSVDSFKAFVDMNQSPHLGIAVAPYHLQRIKASVPEVIEICGKQLFFFYAWQHAPGKQQLPGLGPVDCTPWIAALAKIRYAGYVNPFMHHEPEPDEMGAALAESKKYLERCWAAVEK